MTSHRVTVDGGETYEVDETAGAFTIHKIRAADIPTRTVIGSSSSLQTALEQIILDSGRKIQSVR